MTYFKIRSASAAQKPEYTSIFSINDTGNSLSRLHTNQAINKLALL